MWSGASNAIPTGWLLCDGNNGTPDLRNRFIVGAGNSYAVGVTGGEATHTLTVNEIPSHSHSFTGSSHTHALTLSGLKTDSAGNHTHSLEMYADNTVGNAVSDKGYAAGYKSRLHTFTTESAGGHTHTISGSGSIGSSTAGGSIGSTGSSSAHENRPPYYALCFIMKQ
jgi:tail collar domain protein